MHNLDLIDPAEITATELRYGQKVDIKIYHDQWGVTPRDWTTLGRLWLCDAEGRIGCRYSAKGGLRLEGAESWYKDRSYDNLAEVKEALKLEKDGKDRIIYRKALFANFGDYQSSVTIDTGHYAIGFAVVRQSDIDEIYGGNRPSYKEMRHQLEAELQQYSAWLSGDNYGYYIEDSNGNHIEGCAGFMLFDHDENSLAKWISQDADIPQKQVKAALQHIEYS